MMRYISGGTMPAHAETYVVRAADTLLRDALREGVYCYVLTPRQMGKSSLMIHTAEALREEGVRCAVIDLSAQGAIVEAAQWYRGLIETLGDRLGIEDEIEDFLDRSAHLSPLQRWQAALREVVLAHIDGPIVIFLDEIDITRRLKGFSTDEFFVAIRSCYNARSVDADWNRLTFCLLGAAAPTDLIRDQRITPFNIGRRIDLYDFTPREASLLRLGLGFDDETNRRLMVRIRHWTNGHPYLTQRLCKEVAEAGARGQWQLDTLANVDEICHRLFLAPEQGRSEPNLVFVRQRLAVPDDEERAALLTFYREILRGRRVADEETDERVSPLKLSGVVRPENGRLVVRNRIYQLVFNARWVRNQMPDQERRRQRAAFLRGVRRAALICVPPLLCATVAFVQWRRAEDMQSQRKMVQEQIQRDRYVYDLYKAQRLWEDGDTDGTVQLLKAHIPHRGEKDRRGFEWRYLWGQTHQERKLLQGHKHGVYSLVCSPDGRILASGDFDHTVILWDVATGRELRRMDGLPGWICNLVFSPDGATLAIGLGADTVAQVGLYDTHNYRPLWLRRIGFDAVKGLVFSHNGASVFARSGTQDPTIDRVVALDVRTGAPERYVAVSHSSEGNELAVSPDGRLLAIPENPTSPKKSAQVRILNARTMRQAMTLSGIIGYANLYTAVFSPNGRYLACCCDVGDLFMWDLRRPTHLPQRLHGSTSPTIRLDFSADGRLLAAPGWDGLIRLWHMPEGKPVATIRGHTGPVNAAVFLRDGRTLASAANDSTTRLWDIKEAEQNPADVGHVSWHMDCYCDSVSSDLLVSWSRGILRILDARTLCKVRDMPTPDDVQGITIPEYGHLIFGFTKHCVLAWNPVTGRERLLAKAEAQGISCNKDGRLLAVSTDHHILLLDTTTGRILQRISPDPKYSFAGFQPGAFSPDGRLLAIKWGGSLAATGEEVNRVRIWDLVGNRQVTDLKMPGNIAQSVAFSPDSRLLAASCWAGPVLIWETAAHQEVAQLQGHGQYITALAFSPDGKTLATLGASDQTVKLWNVATWQEIVRMKVPFSASRAGVSFSPEGDRLVVAGPADVYQFHAIPLSSVPQTTP